MEYLIQIILAVIAILSVVIGHWWKKKTKIVLVILVLLIIASTILASFQIWKVNKELEEVKSNIHPSDIQLLLRTKVSMRTGISVDSIKKVLPESFVTDLYINDTVKLELVMGHQTFKIIPPGRGYSTTETIFETTNRITDRSKLFQIKKDWELNNAKIEIAWPPAGWPPNRELPRTTTFEILLKGKRAVIITGEHTEYRKNRPYGGQVIETSIPDLFDKP